MPPVSVRRGPGAPESTWLLDPKWDSVPRLAIDAIVSRAPQVVVVGTHPDDPSLALGATLADMAEKGHAVTVVPATQGGLYLAEDELRERLSDLVDARTLLLTPMDDDGHANHEAVTGASESIVRETGALLLNYPLQLWDWADPSNIEWSRVRMLAPSLRGLQAKAAANSRYSGQLGKAAVDRAHRAIEVVLVPRPPDLAERLDKAVAAPQSRPDIALPFDVMYQSGESDPWHFDDSDYELRRMGLVLACLGRRRYGRVLEIGCATGQLSVLLKGRADEVVGLDASERAIDIARVRTESVRWVLGAAPRDVPEADFDLIVLSEVAYFLDGVDLLDTLRIARRRLRPHGEIVIANWRRASENIPLDGPSVQRQASAMLDLPLRAHYEDADLVVDIWGEPVSVFDASGSDS